MSENTKRALAGRLASEGAFCAFLAVMAGGLWLGGVHWSEVSFLVAFFTAVACHLLGTMRSTKGRWI
jgi:hypothetical protein